MPFADPPALPAFLRDDLPFRRRARILESGPDAGKLVHFVDHGEGQPVLLVHGNPTWCYLWRKVIAKLDPARFRCIAPDVLGFGLSHRLWRASDHQLDRHLASLRELVVSLDLPDGVILVGQDWGGPLTVGAGMAVEDRVAGVVLGNTSVLAPSRPRGTLFHRFAHLPLVSDLIFRGVAFPERTMAFAQGDRRSIRGKVAKAYRWPLRSLKARAGPLGLARMVPTHTDHPSMKPLQEIDAWIRAFSGPIQLVWGERDPILGRALRKHETQLSPRKVTRTSAGHFLQEEVPELLAQAIEEVAAASGPA